MPRRSTARASNLSVPPQPPPNDPSYESLMLLRRQWRWAAFSQFFCTFSQLFSLSDVTITDIEQDLVYQKKNVIPRIMQKMLYSLSYDRKVSVDNWQNALRKQYVKRDPEANPLGIETHDSNRGSKHEEEHAFLDQDANASNLAKDDEDGAEHDLTISNQVQDGLPSKEMGSVVSARQSDAHSRQSSVTGTRASSKAKQLEDEEGTETATLVDWFDLPLLVKLETIHTLSEWQFQNPTRLRTIMKSDDETASWRIEPIGYDSKRNAYWFIGGDRLWIQREPPRVSRPKVLKRKRAPEKGRDKKAEIKPTTPAKRARLGVVPPTPSTPSGRHSRAAKDQAKLKLDMQARELAELNRQVNSSSRSTRATRQTTTRMSSKATPSAPPRPLGTRASARLRGAQGDEEWQPIPDEWLNDEQRSKSQRSKPVGKTGLESDEDSISDLTELSDDGGEAPVLGEQNGKSEESGEVVSNGVEPGVADTPEKEREDEASHQTHENFVEWETICVTLQEWEHIAERFENATHYTEKALYKVLVNDIVPFVTHELKEIERKKELEEALTHRKKSSRLAIRESEREEARLAAKLKQEEEEKMSRARRLEARQQKEEAERLKREKAREQRRQEREAREASRKVQPVIQETPLEPEPPAEVKVTSSKSRPKQNSATQEKRSAKANGKTKMQSGSRIPPGEDWELACEICQRRGINLDDGTPMMSCGRCARWQHIQCHDRADKAAGRPQRNWDAVEFICRACAQQQQSRRDYHPPATQHPSANHAQGSVHPTQPYRSYNQYTHPYNPPIDVRSPQYMASYRDTTQQSYYMRAANGQHPPAQAAYPSNSYPPARAHETVAQSTISFSHYQPSAHGFSPSSQKAHQDPPYSYDHSGHHQSYHNSAQQYSHSSQQQYRSDLPTSYKAPASTPWNVSTPVHTPGYPTPYGNHNAVPTSYRPPPIDPQESTRHNEPAHTSYARYPETHYPSPQFKHHNTSSSYQSPLGRQ